MRKTKKAIVGLSFVGILTFGITFTAIASDTEDYIKDVAYVTPHENLPPRNTHG